jgi:hypothetical protein
MATFDLGIIRIVIGADTGPLDQGTKKVDNAARSIAQSSQELSRRFSALVPRVAPWLTIAGAVLALGAALRSIGTDARELETLSLMTGTSVPRLQEMRYALEGVGGTLQDLTSATNNFSNAIRSSIGDRTSAAALALDQLGIAARNADGTFKTLDEALPDLADRFASWEDGVGKASIATALFGDQAATMIRLLNKGSAGIEEARELAGKSEEAAQKAKDWSDALNVLSRELLAFRDQVILPMIPYLRYAVDLFRDGVLWLRELGARLRTAFTLTPADVQEAIARYEKEIEDLIRTQGDPDTRVGHERFVAMIEDRRKRIEGLRLSLQQPDTPTQTSEGWEMSLTQTTPKSKPREIVPADAKRNIDSALDRIDELTARLDGLPDQQRTIYEQMTAGNATSYEQVQAAIDDVIANYKLEEDQVRRLHMMKRSLLKAQQDTLLDTVAMFGSTLSALFKKSKAIAIAETVLHTGVAVARALRDVPWPLNIAQAAFVAAQGAAQVAAIKSTSESGGGAQAPAATGPTGPQTFVAQHAVTIHGVDRGAWYSGAVVENMISAMNEQLQQGPTSFAYH